MASGALKTKKKQVANKTIDTSHRKFAQMEEEVKSPAPKICIINPVETKTERQSYVSFDQVMNEENFSSIYNNKR